MSHDREIASLLSRLAIQSDRNVEEAQYETVASLTALERLAVQHGLDKASLIAGYELALGGRLPRPQALQLLPLLLPREPISIEAVRLTIGVLGDTTAALPPYAGRVAYDVQSRAIEQLVALLELDAVDVQSQEALDQLYGAIEQGLWYRSLRGPVASLLCLIVRKHHVRSHRIDELRALLRRDPAPPISLLRLFEEYRSFEPMRNRAGRRKRSLAAGRESSPLQSWKVNALAVLDRGEIERESKRQRSLHGQSIPYEHTRALQEGSLGGITSLDELGDKVDSVLLPRQAAEALSYVPGATRRTRPAEAAEDRARSWGFLLRTGYGNDPEHLTRLTHWTISQLELALHDGEPDEASRARAEDLLCRVRDISELGGELVEALEPLLSNILVDWDGQAHRKVILDLITLLKPLTWGDLNVRFLSKLGVLCTIASAEWVADCVACLGALTRNLAIRDNWDPETPMESAYGNLDEDAPYIEALEGILAFADQIILAATERFPTSLVLRTSALGFYESALTLPFELDLPIVIVPSPAFTYICLLSGEVMSLSRICGVIARLREALTGRDSAIVKVLGGRTAKLVASLNERLITLVGTLWQRKFLASEATLGLSADALNAIRSTGETRRQQVANSQSVTTHGALAILARDCLSVLATDEGASTEGLVGPVTLASLKELAKDPAAFHIPFNEFRPRFVEYLEAKGAKGLSDFLFSSLSSLVDRRKAQAAKVSES